MGLARVGESKGGGLISPAGEIAEPGLLTLRVIRLDEVVKIFERRRENYS